jgi:hypothetical protein
VQAIIRFIPSDRGGRRTGPPNAEGYSTPARFESDPEHKLGMWSIRLWNTSQLHGPECIKADVTFLNPDDAPSELLQVGHRFVMLEGLRVVAQGVFVPNELAVPAEVTEFELALLG